MLGLGRADVVLGRYSTAQYCSENSIYCSENQYKSTGVYWAPTDGILSPADK